MVSFFWGHFFWGRGEFRRPPSPLTITGTTCPQRVGQMILPVEADLKEIDEKGRHYQWLRPDLCLRCCESHLWGHGFVESWFDGYARALLLRRYRCPGCGCIIKLKPRGYFKRFQTTIQRIRFNIAGRVKSGKWPVGCGRERCRHWLRSLKRQTMAHLGIEWMDQLPQAFDRLIEMGEVPVSRCI